MQPETGDPRTGPAAAALREMTEKTAQLRQQAEQLRLEIAKISETVTSPTRLVSVTVGAGGVMQGIRVEAAGQRATATQISEAIMRAYGAGCRAAGERSAELVERFSPRSPVAQFMRESLPPADEDEVR